MYSFPSLLSFAIVNQNYHSLSSSTGFSLNCAYLTNEHPDYPCLYLLYIFTCTSGVRLGWRKPAYWFYLKSVTLNFFRPFSFHFIDYYFILCYFSSDLYCNAFCPIALSIDELSPYFPEEIEAVGREFPKLLPWHLFTYPYLCMCIPLLPLLRITLSVLLPKAIPLTSVSHPICSQPLRNNATLLLFSIASSVTPLL